MSEKSSQEVSAENGAPEVQSLTPENSAAWVEKYVVWASKVLDKQAKTGGSKD